MLTISLGEMTETPAYSPKISRRTTLSGESRLTCLSMASARESMSSLSE